MGIDAGWVHVGEKNFLMFLEPTGFMQSGDSVPTFRDNLSVPSSRVKQPNFCVVFVTLEDGTDGFYRNVGKGLALYAA